MGFLAKSLLVLVLGAQNVLASPAPAPNPAITPAPILPRANTKTLGYYTEGGSTSWESWLYDADSVSYTTSGNFFRRCSVGLNCAFYTSCSSGWMVGASGSTYCGAPSATGTFASNYCSWHVLQSAQSAPGSGLSWFWCDQAPLTGYTFFAKAPAAVATATPSALSSAASSARITPQNTRSGASATTPDTPTGPTSSTSGSASSTAPATDNNKSSTPVGAIAGGVVGGVAVLGAIAFAIIFLMRRDKAKKASAAQAAPLMANNAYNQPQGYPQTTEYYGAGGAPAGVGGFASEQKPQAAPAYYPPQQQTQYPMGPYDPHVPQQYTAPSPQPGAAELGAPVTFAPQELPAGHAAPK